MSEQQAQLMYQLAYGEQLTPQAAGDFILKLADEIKAERINREWRNRLSIGRRIYARRKRLNISQDELGEAVSFSGSTVGEWEHGKGNVMPHLPLIAKKLKITIKELRGTEHE